MKISVNQIEWHDATVIEIILSTVSDAFDRFRIRLFSEVFNQDFGKEEITITISNCFKIRTEMNLWIKGMDTVGEVSFQKDSDWIIKERQSDCFKFDDLRHFKLITNSNSVIEALVTSEDCFEVE